MPLNVHVTVYEFLFLKSWDSVQKSPLFPLPHNLYIIQDESRQLFQCFSQRDFKMKTNGKTLESAMV
jgi:hypothetical protein